MEKEPEILNEEVLEDFGTFKRIRRYLRGWHPERGELHFGWTGKETIEEKDVLFPKGKFEVKNQ